MPTRIYFSEMLVCFRCHFPSPWGSLQKTLLYQERLIHFFQCTCFFTHGGCNSGETNRPAFEFFDDGQKDLIVHIIEAIFIYVQRFECVLCNTYIDDTVIEHLCKISYSS